MADKQQGGLARIGFDINFRVLHVSRKSLNTIFLVLESSPLMFVAMIVAMAKERPALE